MSDSVLQYFNLIKVINNNLSFLNEKNEDNEIFINSICKENEMDLGYSSFDIISRIFEFITEDKSLKVMYLEPYIVKEFLWRIDFLYNQLPLLVVLYRSQYQYQAY